MQTTTSKAAQKFSICNWITIAFASLFASLGHGSENVPHRPFAMWADVPLQGQFIAGLVYEESEA